LNSLNRDECSLIKKEEKPYTGSEYHNFIVVLKSLTHFGSKYFAKKKRKSADERKTFITSLSSEFNINSV
jgi:hypothetical protein